MDFVEIRENEDHIHFFDTNRSFIYSLQIVCIIFFAKIVHTNDYYGLQKMNVRQTNM